ncbi:MAG: ABC transporter ATP-binding protein [Planctomycetota bacterium]|jgi:ABC-2 type transport system ATP-binding protein
MSVVSVSNLAKFYRVHRKPEGLGASIKSLFKRTYKEVRAVDGISFDIEPGEMVGFLGPNGAGKTTTLKMLSGLIYPAGGTATVLGYTPWERKNEYRRQFALLMGQKNQLWWDLPAAESFRLHKEIYGISDSSFRTVQGELTELLDVGHLIHQPVRELSLGERMKMELIASLLHSPRILFLDEPTIGLDVVAQATIRKCLREYNRRRDVTVMLTSHYMQDVEAICDRVIVINHGRLIHDGPLHTMMSEYADSKILTVQFEGQTPENLEDVGDVLEINPPKVKIRMRREDVAQRAASLLDRFAIADVTIEDPPIEDVIADVFSGRNGDSGA